MVKRYSLLVIFIIFIISKNSLTIESAVHQAELAKCVGILLTIQHNEFDQRFKAIAKNTFDHYFERFSRLEMNGMAKEMSEKGANLIITLNEENKNNEIHNLLTRCIMTFRVGN